MLAEQLGLHPRAVRDCASRNPVPKVHRYADHVFVVLHAPERGARGHVHYVELDQFVGPGYVVTVHGPTNPEVPPASALVETDAVLRRLESGRLRPGSPAELSFAIVTALTNRLRDYLTSLTEEVWRLERTVTGGHMGDPEQFFYRTRTNTKMAIAAERLAVIAAVTLPVTAISSVMGMNVIVSGETHAGILAVLLTGMAVMSVTLLVWARRKGWW
ncbi:MAG: Mg2 transporter protein CorA family protein [Pseudonocardia sp.]|uniref:CorA family divalent cation transporter n=1 Tax=Pseudonocardia sp. TaxID=60912 RepID=UPI00262A446F|nr:CorA family divalent cation transporter [Pseudonocardia sp.]MCU1626696.1 Mg2 transporter protein CorA family protein [Pseudonocardia sp.]